jgi:hypothetical protein
VGIPTHFLIYLMLTVSTDREKRIASARALCAGALTVIASERCERGDLIALETAEIAGVALPALTEHAPAHM